MKDTPNLRALLDAIPDMTLVLDQNRRAVFVNQALRDFLGVEDPGRLTGLRTGTLIGCIHAADHPDGCGESESCTYCGANQAYRDALRTVRTARGECRVTLLRQGQHESYDLEINAHPFEHEGQTWLLSTIKDIGHLKRRRALERIFFHDILNTAGGLRGLLDLMREIQDPAELHALADEVAGISHNLLDEIQAQKELNLAENGELAAYMDRHLVAPLLREAVFVVTHHKSAQQRRVNIEIDPVDPKLTIHTDRTLLMRVLINTLKNAAEASQDQGTVNLYVRTADTGGRHTLRFCVHNDGHMSREVQLQLFQRSFSTKGSNRGLGTYSMKLITERYLKGRISFESDPGTGTTFMVELAGS